MKKNTVWLFAIFFLLLSCSKENTHPEAVIAEINDFKLTLNEFQRQLAAELEFNDDFKVTQTAKTEFLEALIEKEILIQEAKKRKLDRKEKFIQAIERYWESTLIRNLIDLKGAEIDKSTVVSQEEMADHYNKLKAKDPGMPPLSEIEDMIHEEVKEEKKRIQLKAWITQLKKDARININEDLLQH